MGQAAASPQPQASFKTGEAAKEVRHFFQPRTHPTLHCSLLFGYVSHKCGALLTEPVLRTPRAQGDMLVAQHPILQSGCEDAEQCCLHDR